MEKARFKYIKGELVCFRYHDTSKTITIAEVGLKEQQSLIKQYSSNVPGFLRSKSLMTNLGRLYLLRHIFYGNSSYIFKRYLYRLLYKIGIKKLGLMPF